MTDEELLKALRMIHEWKICVVTAAVIEQLKQDVSAWKKAYRDTCKVWREVYRERENELLERIKELERELQEKQHD